MAKSFICNQCSHEIHKWEGRCSQCESWNSFISKSDFLEKEKDIGAITADSDFLIEEIAHRRSGIKEFDRVLPNGLQEGSVTLISGEPGVGKSTLLAQVLGGFAQQETDQKFLYVSGEENVSQIGKRFNRLGVNNSNLYLLSENELETIKSFIEKFKPKVIVLDSVQVVTTTSGNFSSGSVNLVKLITEEVVNLAKSQNLTFILIGQKTKDGALAGPKHLEHMVDTVLSFENGKDKNLKVLRVNKNRFGHTNHIGILQMKSSGFGKNAFKLKKLGDEKRIGKTLGVISHSERCELVEVEALVCESYQGSPKRISLGVESGRLALLSAVMEKYLDVSFQQKDIYVKVCSPSKVSSRSLDLAIVLSTLSSLLERPVDPKLAAIGEVSLTGQLQAANISKAALTQLSEIGLKTLVGHSEKNTDSLSTKFLLPKSINGLEELIR